MGCPGVVYDWEIDRTEYLYSVLLTSNVNSSLFPKKEVIEGEIRGMDLEECWKAEKFEKH